MEQDTLEDNSGGQNFGMLISDYTFDEEIVQIGETFNIKLKNRKFSGLSPKISKNKKMKAY
jgi:hypothetical protein